jgi:hypothetical protein
MKKKILTLFVFLFVITSYSYSEELFFKLKENHYPGFTIKEQIYQLDELVEITATNFELHGKSTYNSREINSVTIYFTTEYSIGSSNEFKEVPMGAYRNYRASWGKHSYTKENVSGDDNCYVAIIDGWDQKAYISIKDLLGQEIVEQKVPINFRFKIEGFCDYEGSEKDRGLKEGSIVIDKQVMVYNCDYIVGEITTDQGVAPNIGTELVPIYGVYNSLSDNNEAIKILSSKISHPVSIPNEKFEYRIYDANMGAYSTIPTDLGTYDATLKLVNFRFDNKKVGGEIKKIYKVYVNDNFECKSNELTFQSVAPISLPGFNSEEMHYICPSSQTFVPGAELDCMMEDVLSIDGNRIESVDNSLLHNEALYGVSYGWEYYTSKNPRKTIELSSSNTSSPNLCVAKAMIEKDVVYCFRQYAVMGKFGGIKVYSNADIKTINVSCYTPISKDLFSINEFSPICEGDVYDGNLKLQFYPKNSEVYSSVLKDKKNQFDYSVESNIVGLNGQYTATDLIIPFYEELQDSKHISLVIKDGCNNSIQFDKSLTVNLKPELSKEDISVVGASITNATIGLSDDLKISSQGNFTLFIEDNEPNVRYYIYYLTDQKDSDGLYIWDEGKPIGSNGHLISSTIKDKKWYKENIERGIKIVKVDNKNTTHCESVPIYLSISYKENLYNNIISFAQNILNGQDSVQYLCRSDKSPHIVASEVLGGYGLEGTYSYQWQYSVDNQTWMNMLTSDGKFVVTESLDEGVWNMPTHTTYYIRRKSISHIDINDTESYITGISNVLKVKPRSTPIFSVQVNSEEKESLNVCYESTLDFDIRLENKQELEQQGIYDMHPFYFYVSKTNDTTEISHHELSNFYVTDTIIVKAYIEDCGEKIYSQNSILVKPYSNLLKDLSVVYGDCMVRGENVSIHINSPKFKESDYGFVFLSDNLNQIDTVRGISCNKIKLPQNGSKSYSVFVLSDRGCKQEKEFRIDNSEMDNSLSHSKLVVEVQNSQGTKIEGDTFFVCASSPLTIADEIVLEENPEITYVWNVNNGANINKNYSSLISTGTHFNIPQQLYRVVRTSSDLNNCRRVSDTVYVKTLGEIDYVEVSLSEEKICFGEGVDLNVKAVGGSGEYYYQWSLSGIPILGLDSTNNNLHLPSVDTAGMQEIKVRISDKNCIYSTAYQVEESRYLEVEDNLSFTLSSTPAFIEESDLLGGKRKEVLLNFHPINSSNELRLGDSLLVAGVPTIFDGTLNVQLESSDFINNLASLAVTRFGSSNKRCISHNTVAIPLSEGFDGMPMIESNLSGLLPTTTCGGEEIILSLTALPLYNNQPLVMKNVSYTWYRGNQQNQWANIGTGENITIEANTGTIDRYYAKLTYEIEGRKVSVSSNVFEVTGKSLLHVGDILFVDGSEKTIHYVCKGLDGELTMKLGTTIDDAASYQWYQMVAGSNEWQEVIVEGATVGTTSNECTIDLSNYHSSTMFRLGVTDKCSGKEFYSENNIWLKFNEGVTFSSEDIMVSNSLIYNDIKGLSAVRLVVRNDYNSTYYWTKDAELKEGWIEGNPVEIEGPFIGENTIYGYKQSKGKGNCLSDTVEFRFKSYAQLVADPLFVNNQTPVCKSDETPFTFSLNSIVGGDGLYEVEWYYKSDNMGGFVMLDTLNIDTTLFRYEGSALNYGALGATAQIRFSHLAASTEFFAMVKSVGDYKGSSYLSNTLRKEVFEPLQDNGIDIWGEMELCYGDEIGVIKGHPVSGGSGEYNFQWQANLLNSENEYEGWKNITMAESQNFNVRYPMYSSGKIRRLVSDKNCRTVLTPKQEVIVRVNEEVKILSDDIGYTSYVANGASANMWGKTQNVDYVWYDENNIPCDTTRWTENFITPSIMNSPTIYYAALLAKNGCLSSNRDTLLISTYMVDGGHLTFDNYDHSASNYWICSGSQAGKISCDGIEDSLNGHTYEWYYRVNDSDESNKSLGVYTFDIDLDKCNLQHTLFTNSSTGGTLEKKISFYRMTRFDVNNNGVIEKRLISSDTVSLYIVPTLSLVESKMWEGESLAGKLQVEGGNNFCYGESAKVKIQISDSLYKFWETGYYGPKQYDKYSAHYSTWVEYLPSNKLSQGGWIVDEKSRLENDAIGVWLLADLSTNYYVQFAFSDGCSTSYSDYVRVALSNKVADFSEITMFAITPEGEKIIDGFEYGDSLVVRYGDLLYDCYWFGNSTLTDTLSKGGYSFGTIISEETPSELYLARFDSEKGCMSQKIQIPLPIYSKSLGGKLAYIGENLICKSDSFNEILNKMPASGMMISPSFGVEREFQYQWQVATDGEGKIWKDIPSANNLNLSKEKLNSITTENVVCYMFRRKATNESGRVCFSDTVTLRFFDDFVPGVISSSSPKNAFCATDSFPRLSSTSPAGGVCGVDGLGYQYKWQYSFDGKEFMDLQDYTRYGGVIDLNLLLRTQTALAIDFSTTHNLFFKAIYRDGNNGCGEVQSNVIKIKIWEQPNAPKIYQDNKSCDANEVLVRVQNEGGDYTHSWYMLDKDGNMRWASVVADSMEIKRISDIVEVTSYGVRAESNISGCPSPITYFDVDSLPKLTQETISGPAYPLCYNSDLKIEGGIVSGGNGSKNFEWQYSYDGLLFETSSFDKDLEIEKQKTNVYYRRIVNDLCSSDTSNIVYVKVKPMIELIDKELFLLSDYKCKNRNFNISIAQADFDSIMEKYQANDHNSVSIEIFEEGNFKGSFKESKYSITMDGFEADSKKFEAVLVVVDSMNNRCESDPLAIIAHTALPLDESRNTISCHETTPCNHNIVFIEGDFPSVSDDGEHIEFSWFCSSDNQSWRQILLRNKKDIYLQVEDTMFVKRRVTNGCDTLWSNSLSFIAKPVETIDYVKELSLEVITQLTDDSDSVILYARNKEIATGYEFMGDGELPIMVYGSQTLPYTSTLYKDSLLKIQKIGDCYSDYCITPLRGGRIHSDRSIEICKGVTVPSFVVTDVEGGTGVYHYQWQYRNEYFSKPEYVNIEGATTKEYKPDPIEVKTWYRRVTYSGEYLLYSNEVLVTLVEEPTVGKIITQQDSSYFSERGLKLSEYFAEKTSDSEIILLATIKDAYNAYWQVSDDNENWEKISLPIQINGDTILSIQIQDSFDVRYYRLVAENLCGTTYSEGFKLLTLNDVPMILDEQIQIIQNALCVGDECQLRIGDYLSYSGLPTCSGAYSYRLNGYDDIYLHLKKYSEGELIKPVGDFVITLKNISRPIELQIERVSEKTGLSSVKTYLLDFELFKADFEFSVLTQNNDIRYHATTDNVEIEQGALVQFFNTTEKKLQSIGWLLIDSKDYDDFGDVDLSAKGLYSYKENPLSYFYTGGRYTVKMYAVSENGCRDTVESSALYIPWESVRNAKTGVGFISDDYCEGNFDNDMSFDMQVYPTLFDDWIEINYLNREFEYRVYNLLGQTLLQGKGYSSTLLKVDYLLPGNYLLEIEGRRFKVIKK